MIDLSSPAGRLEARLHLAYGLQRVFPGVESEDRAEAGAARDRAIDLLKAMNDIRDLDLTEIGRTEAVG